MPAARAWGSRSRATSWRRTGAGSGPSRRRAGRVDLLVRDPGHRPGPRGDAGRLSDGLRARPVPIDAAAGARACSCWPTAATIAGRRRTRWGRSGRPSRSPGSTGSSWTSGPRPTASRWCSTTPRFVACRAGASVRPGLRPTPSPRTGCRPSPTSSRPARPARSSTWSSRRTWARWRWRRSARHGVARTAASPGWSSRRSTGPRWPRSGVCEPAWPCWLNTVWLSDRAIRTAVDLGCAGIAAEWHRIDARRVARVRAAGLELAAWTVRDADVRDRLAGLGVVAACVEGAALPG